MNMLVRWAPFNDVARLPAVDVVENNDKIELFADLPGVKQEDLDIQVEKDVLTIRGERKGERSAGAFSRAFTLPKHVDAEKIGATLKDGVLTLTLPKRPEAQPRHIKVAVAA
jgi:HSP20 family protein